MLKGEEKIFRRILVATDLSPASFVVVRHMGELAFLGVQECLLVQCVNVSEEGVLVEGFLKKGELAEQEEMLKQQGYAVTALVLPGMARLEIDRIARERGCSLIVVGSHGQTLARDLFLGSVASEIIQRATRPILVMRLSVTKDSGKIDVRCLRHRFREHVLFATDFSENAGLAFAYLKHMVACGLKHVTLVHVQDKNRLDPHLLSRLEEFNEVDRGRLEKMREELKKEGEVQVTVEIPYGVPIEELLGLVRKRDVQMVVMGSQGRRYIQELFLGSVSHALARFSEAAVMLIPARQKVNNSGGSEHEVQKKSKR